MNVGLFLKKYYKLIEDINSADVDSVDAFYTKVYTEVFDYMADYYNFITEYSDETEGDHAIQAMHRLIRKLNLPVNEFKVPSLALHIFYNEGI